MNEKAEHQEPRTDDAASEKRPGGNCATCGRSPCICNGFPDVLGVELLDYGPPEPDSGGSS